MSSIILWYPVEIAEKIGLFDELKEKDLKMDVIVKVMLAMSFRAEFVIAKRSLYQLIYDKSDDWLNPKNN